MFVFAVKLHEFLIYFGHNLLSELLFASIFSHLVGFFFFHFSFLFFYFVDSLGVYIPWTSSPKEAETLKVIFLFLALKPSISSDAINQSPWTKVDGLSYRVHRNGRSGMGELLAASFKGSLIIFSLHSYSLTNVLRSSNLSLPFPLEVGISFCLYDSLREVLLLDKDGFHIMKGARKGTPEHRRRSRALFIYFRGGGS